MKSMGKKHNFSEHTRPWGHCICLLKFETLKVIFSTIIWKVKLLHHHMTSQVGVLRNTWSVAGFAINMWLSAKLLVSSELLLRYVLNFCILYIEPSLSEAAEPSIAAAIFVHRPQGLLPAIEETNTECHTGDCFCSLLLLGVGGDSKIQLGRSIHTRNPLWIKTGTNTEQNARIKSYNLNIRQETTYRYSPQENDETILGSPIGRDLIGRESVSRQQICVCSLCMETSATRGAELWRDVHGEQDSQCHLKKINLRNEVLFGT